MKKKGLCLMIFSLILYPFSETFITLGGQEKVQTAEASTEELEGINEDVVFEEMNSNQYVYTYSNEGEDYKNIEVFVSETEVHSEIYMLNKETQEYELVDSIITVVEKDTVKQTSEQTNEYSEVPIEAMSVNLKDSMHFEENLYQIAASSWKYNKTYTGSNNLKLQRFTVGAIAIIVASITKLPQTARTVTQVANLYFQINASKAYYKTVVYKDSNAPRNRPNFKHVTTFYKNSARTQVLKSNVVRLACSSTCNS